MDNNIIIFSLLVPSPCFPVSHIDMSVEVVLLPDPPLPSLCMWRYGKSHIEEEHEVQPR